MQPALVLLEFHSIAIGIAASDAMAKRVVLETFALGTVQPGKFLVAAGGEVANVEEAWAIGRTTGGEALVGEVFLADVHRAIPAALSGSARGFEGDALGVIETTTVVSTLRAADRALKSTDTELSEFRLADGLGGKGYALLSGEVGEVEAAVEAAVDVIPRAELIAQLVIPQLDLEVSRNLRSGGSFSTHWNESSAAGTRRAKR